MSASYVSLLLADARLPTGAHTQSAGVEPALMFGMDLAQLPDYVLARLESVTETEAATAVVARHAYLTDADLSAVDRAWRVRTLSDVLRDASDLLGRSYLRLAATVWQVRLAAGTTWCRPVVVGATAAAAGLDAASTARLVAYDDVQTAIAAALKLRPFDPATGVAWAAAAGAGVEALVARVAGLIEPDQIPARAAPELEAWAQLHHDTERRLFRA